MSPARICCGVSAWKGVSRHSISQSTMPSDHTSAFSLTRSGSLTSSGAMYGSVPLRPGGLCWCTPINYWLTF